MLVRVGGYSLEDLPYGVAQDLISAGRAVAVQVERPVEVRQPQVECAAFKPQVPTVGRVEFHTPTTLSKSQRRRLALQRKQQ